MGCGGGGGGGGDSDGVCGDHINIQPPNSHSPCNSTHAKKKREQQ